MQSNTEKPSFAQHLQQLSIRSDQYKQAGSTAQASAATRRSEAAAASRSSRDSLLRAKRLRQGPDASASFQSGQLVQSESPQTQITQLVKTISAASVTPHGKLKSVRTLRRLLSSGDAPLSAAAQAGAGTCLAKILMIRQYNAVELKMVFEAAWAITNLAAGPPESVASVLPAAPLLAVLLRSNSTHIAEQSAWAIGNLAGESAAVRSRLHANGAVRPLLHLLLAAQHDPQPRARSTACTAAWALSNLLQDQSHAIKELFLVPGGPEGLVNVLGTSSDPDLLVETAWVVCHVTHSQPDANRLVRLGLIQAAVQPIHSCTQQAGSGEEGMLAALPLLNPLLRTVANLAALGGQGACSHLLSHPACECISAMASVCLASEEPGLQAEAAWLCASIAAMPHKENNSNTDRRSQVLWPLLPALVHVFANGKAHAQREAAYALANLLACGPGPEGDIALELSQLLTKEKAWVGQERLRSEDEELVCVMAHLLGSVLKSELEGLSDIRALLADKLNALAR